MTQDEIQDILDHAYPLIKSYFGKGKLDYPKIDTSYKNTYAMHSGEPEAEGEHRRYCSKTVCKTTTKHR